MTEPLFPSGPWTGFYQYAGPKDKHRMDLQLTFTNGNLAGTGGDDIGSFLIKGHYDPKEMECYWTKTYVGGHDVFYRGFREGKGIWGTWEIGLHGRGGFHIWPRRVGESDALEETAKAGIPSNVAESEETLAPSVVSS
jgi:hypothetical protein